MSGDSGFGIFAPLFRTAPGFLSLLNLHTEDAPATLAQVSECCRSVADPHPHIRQLLMDPNWRPHLVAAVAVLLTGYDASTVNRLWQRVDRGSWVTPQLGVTLFLFDPDFAAQCRPRLEAGCPLDLTESLAMSGLERHSATGPAGPNERSAKAAATLLHLVQLLSPVPDWVEPLSASDEIRRLLAVDAKCDASAQIVQNWLEQIQKLYPDVP